MNRKKKLYFANIILIISIFININFLCCSKSKKALFRPCAKLFPSSDIVFILDQSGTMHQNDDKALRWQAIHEIVNIILKENNTASETNKSMRFAFIPFGGADETNVYNNELRWFDAGSLEILNEFLDKWYQKSRSKADTAKYSDFWSPFKIMANHLPWRQNIARFIIFISDGKYNIVPAQRRAEEESQFQQFLDYLRNHRGTWPVYFVGFGFPGVDEFKESNVNIQRLKQMAEANSLPLYMIDNIPSPTFSEPYRIAPNAIAIVSTDIKVQQRELRTQIENILREIRRIRIGDISSFPIFPLDLVEIEVLTKSDIKTDLLLKSLDLFIETIDDKSYSEKLVPCYSRANEPNSRLHRFIVNTPTSIDPNHERFKLEKIKKWGLKVTKSFQVDMEEVNLIIKDNWSVCVDTCIIERIKKSRCWCERIFHLSTQPSYKLILEAKAFHPCGNKLPTGKLKIYIENKEIDQIKPVKQEARSVTINNKKHTYYVYHWEKIFENRKELERYIGTFMKIDIELIDLYACHLSVPTEVPINGKEYLKRSL